VIRGLHCIAPHGGHWLAMLSLLTVLPHGCCQTIHAADTLECSQELGGAVASP